jgi:hypothetical protein
VIERGHRGSLGQGWRLQIVNSKHGYSATMKTAVVAMVLATAIAGMSLPAGASADVVGVVGAPAPIGWSTGGFAPPPPPPPDWCTPDNPDPACHPPPPHYTTRW